MRAFLAFHLTVLMGASAFAVVPDVDLFRPVPQYPAPAAGASLTLGAVTTNNGRLVLWDGDTVYLQEFTSNVLGAQLEPVATGYVGNPSVVAIKSNNRRVILGSGEDALVYDITDITNASDFQTGDEIDVVTHFSGALISDNLLLLDRERDDMNGAELVIVDLALAKANDPDAIAAVLQKPAGSFPTGLFIDHSANRVYVMDGATRELRWFTKGTLSNAFTNATEADWSTDGTLVGTAGQFLNGGVAGVNPSNELIIGGDTGTPGTGGIQYVKHTAPLEIVGTIDPAGTGPAYVLIYNRRLDELIAIDTAASPPDAYATTEGIPAIPPDSPCEDFDDIELEFAAFIAAFSPDANDLDGDGIRDTAMLALLELFSCRNTDTSALALSTNTAYDDNREIFATEANAAALMPYERIIPVLLSMNQAMQTSVFGLLSTATLSLSGSYVSITCSDLDTCEPEFVEDPFVARIAPRGVTEPYFGTGDPDGDGLTNLEEYTNNEGKGGDDLDFAVAAASDQLDGGSGISGSSGGCFIATAAYGTPVAAQLDTLRAIRDRALLTSAPGSAVVDAYYRVSPAMAAWIAERPAARAAVRVSLLPFVSGQAEAWAAGLLGMVIVSASIARRLRKPAAAPRK